MYIDKESHTMTTGTYSDQHIMQDVLYCNRPVKVVRISDEDDVASIDVPCLYVEVNVCSDV